MRWRFRGGVFLAVACLFTSVLAASPITADEHFARAAQLAGNGKVEQAEQEYQAGLKLRPGDSQAWNNLGALYFGRRALTPAIGAFEHAHSLQPGNSEINFNLGLALYQAGQTERAVQYLQVASRAAAYA